MAIAVDRLAEERDLLATLLGERWRTSAMISLRRAALLRAANAGDDAIRAELVAPDHDPHVRLVRRRAHRRIAQRVEAFVAPRQSCRGNRFCGRGSPPGPRLAVRSNLANEVRHLVQLSRDRRPCRRSYGALKDQLLILLRHAAHDAERPFRDAPCFKRRTSAGRAGCRFCLRRARGRCRC